MNALEHFFCSSSFWRCFCERKMLPWVLAGNRPGEHVLEIGAGYGAGTRYLENSCARVTALEYDPRSVLRLKRRNNRGLANVVCGDGTKLPFAAATFTSATAMLVLHHLKSEEQQNQMLAEAARVLRPGGVFVGFEILDSRLNRVIHVGSTFTPFAPEGTIRRLTAAGFGNVSMDVRSAAFRFSATKGRVE